MTVGEKILLLNLELQNMHFDNDAAFFTSTIPQKLMEIKRFVAGLRNRHDGLALPSDNCMLALDQAIATTEATLHDAPPNNFQKERRLFQIKQSIRLALLSVYDTCCHESVNLAHEPI